MVSEYYILLSEEGYLRYSIVREFGNLPELVNFLNYKKEYDNSSLYTFHQI